MQRQADNRFVSYGKYLKTFERELFCILTFIELFGLLFWSFIWFQESNNFTHPYVFVRINIPDD